MRPLTLLGSGREKRVQVSVVWLILLRQVVVLVVTLIKKKRLRSEHARTVKSQEDYEW